MCGVPHFVTAPLLLLRLLLMLVLATGPLVASAMAEDGTWSRVWANPFDGTVQAAEEEEPSGTHDADSSPEEATLWALSPLAATDAPWQYRSASQMPPVPPPTGDPTPPPEAA